jgi:hypothetical protein
LIYGALQKERAGISENYAISPTALKPLRGKKSGHRITRRGKYRTISGHSAPDSYHPGARVPDLPEFPWCDASNDPLSQSDCGEFAAQQASN